MPNPNCIEGKELMLSSQALAELMRGTLTKGFSFRFTVMS